MLRRVILIELGKGVFTERNPEIFIFILNHLRLLITSIFDCTLELINVYFHIPMGSLLEEAISI